MLQQKNRPSLQSSHKILCILTLHLLLTHFCRGQSQLIGPSQPIAATVGDDIILPCQLQPAEDVAAITLEWTRSDLDPIFVHVRRAGQDLPHVKHPSYQGRTSVSIDRLKQGNISLKLSKVKLSDGGKYRCFIPKLNKQSFIELIVASGAISSPVISVTSIDRDTQTVVLQCESKGQPEVLWLDSEGNFLFAGPTETIRGPDGLYTVSSRVTVEKRHSNNFTCRVQQKNTNQIRETYIIVPDDLFKAQPSSSPAIIGVAVSLVVFIVVVVAVFFFEWKWKQNKTRRRPDETEGGGNKNLSKSGDTEMDPLNPAGPDGQTHPVSPAVSEENKTQAGKNSTESPVNVEVDPNGRFIHLTNESKEDLKLEGWKLRVKLNHENPIMYTFEKSIKLKAEENVYIWTHGSASRYPGPSDLRWKDLKRWTRGDKLLVELINCDEEIVKTTETQGSSQHDNTNPAGKNSTEVFVQVDPDRKYLRLTNESKEDLKLEGWKLRVKLNVKNPITYTFKELITLRAEKSVTIWASGGIHSPPSDLLWKDMQRWAKGDKLLVELVNFHGDIMKTIEV